MLVITRRLQEKTTITVPPSEEPRVIEITVTRIQPGTIRLGYDADRDIIIRRTELPDLADAESPPTITDEKDQQ
jgi:sRNA-binding carbon storage regulator CsrA